MSEFKISCPSCDQHIACNESYYGVQINCPTCGAPMTVPAPASHPGHAPTGSRLPNLNVPNGLKIPKPDASPTAPRESGPSHAPRKQMRHPSKPRGNSWLTTFLLAWFLGGFGIDRFYNGRTGLGVGKLLGTILTCGVVGAIWAWIDVLLLLFRKYQDARGNTLRPAQRSHMVIALSLVGVGILLTVIVTVSAVRDIKSEFAGFGDTSQRINCVNNLSQLGMAFRMWSMDHGDQFPFNVPAEKGGTLEDCRRTADGFDASAFRHLQVMSNELNTPKVLVCPADTSKEPAKDWESLNSSYVSYLLRSGTQLSEEHPGEVLAQCPIHGTRLYCDAQVKQERNQ